MNKKIFGIVICTLLILTALPAVEAVNVSKNKNISVDNNEEPAQISILDTTLSPPWSDGGYGNCQHVLNADGKYKLDYNEYDYYEFEKVYINVVGKCRSISYIGEDPWIDEWHNGSLKGAGAATDGLPGENVYLNIIIRNNFGVKLFKGHVTRGSIFANDVYGKFYWEGIYDCISEYPPNVSIKCHANGKVGIFVYDGEVEIKKEIEKNPLILTNMPKFALFFNYLLQLPLFKTLQKL